MKTFNRLLYAIFFCIVGCTVPPPSSDSSEESSPTQQDGPVLEIVADYTLVTYNRLLNLEDDVDFIDESIRQSIIQSSRYKKSLLPKTKNEDTTSQCDTLSMSEEIPFCADIYEATTVFRDGQVEYLQEINLNPDTNPLLGFHSTPIDISGELAKVEVKDGVARTYSLTGELLSEMEIEMPDYTHYIEALNKGLSEQSITKTTNKKDIKWLQEKMAQETSVSKSGLNDSYNVYEREDGTVVLEQFILPTKTEEPIMVRTLFSSDISLNYGYEQYVDGHLQIRCRYSYDETPTITKGVYYTSDAAEQLPSKCVIESLNKMIDGTPTLMIEEKLFRTNKTVINL